MKGVWCLRGTAKQEKRLKVQRRVGCCRRKCRNIKSERLVNDDLQQCGEWMKKKREKKVREGKSKRRGKKRRDGGVRKGRRAKKSPVCNVTAAARGLRHQVFDGIASVPIALQNLFRVQRALRGNYQLSYRYDSFRSREIELPLFQCYLRGTYCVLRPLYFHDPCVLSLSPLSQHQGVINDGIITDTPGTRRWRTRAPTTNQPRG